MKILNKYQETAWNPKEIPNKYKVTTADLDNLEIILKILTPKKRW